MQPLKMVEVNHYEGLRLPYRIAVGDLIRSKAFANCILWNSALHSLAGRLWVWSGPEGHLLSIEQHGQGFRNVESTRAESTYLVEEIKMTVGSGPDDIFPNQYRMSRVVSCLRLSDDGYLPREKESICFSLNEPMSLLNVDEGQLELVGYAKLPITWEET